MNEKRLVDVQGVFSVRSVDIQSGQCEGPVYNEIEDYGSDSLDSEIAQYNQDGVTVHVQVVSDLDGLSTVQQYADAVTVECGWNEADSMVVTVMFDGEDVLFDVVRSGKIDVLVAKSGRVNEIDTVFEDSLSDASVPFEDAVADMLDTTQRVTSESIETPVQPNEPKSETAQPPKNDTNIDVPYGPIGIGVGVLGVFGAGAALVRNRKRFNTEASAVEEAITTNRVSVFDAIEKAKAVVATLPADETEELAHTISVLEEANARVNGGRLDAEAALKQQRGRFIRGTSGIRDILSQPTEDGIRLSDAMRTATEEAAALMQTVSAIEESIQTIDARLQAFVGTIDAFGFAQAKINKDGYVSQGWRDAYTELREVASKAGKLRTKGAVLSVQDLIEEQEAHLTELMEKVAAVPEWHEEVIAKYEQTQQQQKDAVALIEQAKDAAAAVRATYDTSCFGDIDTHLEEASTLLRNVTNFIQNTSLSDVKKKDVDALAANEAAIIEMQGVISDVMSHSNAVVDHKILLERIAENAPTQVDTIADDVTSVIDLAIGYGSDVEPSTVAEARDLQAATARLSALLQEQKPQYLTIHKTAEKLDEDVRATAAKVQSEYAEMVRMRADVSSGTTSLDAAVRDLRIKAQRNQNDIDLNTRQLLQTLEIYQGEPHTRNELRSALGVISSLLDRYNSVASAVSVDIQKASARRTRTSSGTSSMGGYSSSSRSSGSTRRKSSSSSPRRISGGSRSSSSRSSGSTKRR